MKRLSGIFVVGCLAATLVHSPAAGSTRDLPSRKQAAKLCRAFFAEDRCDNLAAQWRLTLAAQTPAAAERFVQAIMVDGRKDAGPGSEECRLVFSETVCSTYDIYYEWTYNLVMWVVTDPEGFVNAWRTFALQYVDEAYRIVDGAYADVKARVRCAIDPTCTPLPI